MCLVRLFSLKLYPNKNECFQGKLESAGLYVCVSICVKKYYFLSKHWQGYQITFSDSSSLFLFLKLSYKVFSAPKSTLSKDYILLKLLLISDDNGIRIDPPLKPFFSCTGHRPASLCHGPLSIMRPSICLSMYQLFL